MLFLENIAEDPDWMIEISERNQSDQGQTVAPLTEFR